MLDTYILMCRDIKVGYIAYDDEEDLYSFSLDENFTDISSLPIPIYNPKDLRLDQKIKEKHVRLFVGNRVLPRDRDNLEYLLDLIGLHRYEIWELFKKSKGMTFDDYYWITKSENEKFEDTHIRYLMECGVLKEIPTPITIDSIEFVELKDV